MGNIGEFQEGCMNTILTLVRRLLYLTLAGLDRVRGQSIPAVFVLCYHSIGDTGARISVSTADFKKHIDYLIERYDCLSANELEEYLSGSKQLAKPSFVLTFDDGYADVAGVEPYLTQKGILPIVFVISDPSHADKKELGNDLPFLDRRQLKTLIEKGWAVGSHSATHPYFAALKGDGIVREVTESKKDIEKAIGGKVKYMAFPRGRYSEAIIKEVRRAGYTLAFTMDDAVVSPVTDKLHIPRIAINNTHSWDEFIASFSPSVIRLRGLIKRTRFAKLYD